MTSPCAGDVISAVKGCTGCSVSRLHPRITPSCEYTLTDVRTIRMALNGEEKQRERRRVVNACEFNESEFSARRAFGQPTLFGGSHVVCTQGSRLQRRGTQRNECAESRTCKRSRDREWSWPPARASPPAKRRRPAVAHCGRTMERPRIFGTDAQGTRAVHDAE